MAITIKNDRDIERMKVAGHVVSVCHQRVEAAVAPGVTTGELDAIVVDTLREHDALASFLGYNGFPASICASVNEEIVHGFPGKRVLQEGDIIAVDIGAIVDGCLAELPHPALSTNATTSEYRAKSRHRTKPCIVVGSRDTPSLTPRGVSATTLIFLDGLDTGDDLGMHKLVISFTRQLTRFAGCVTQG